MRRIIYLFYIIFLINITFADTNGIWHYPSDIRGGIFGFDEENVNNYTFQNSVYFKENIYIKELFDINNSSYYLNLKSNSNFNEININKAYINSNLIVNENIGIGVLNPSSKLEVNGKIKMFSETQDSDSNNTVVTKGYLLNKFGSGSSSELPIKKEIFTSSSIWTVPPRVTNIYVALVGGGGGAHIRDRFPRDPGGTSKVKYDFIQVSATGGSGGYPTDECPKSDGTVIGNWFYYNPLNTPEFNGKGIGGSCCGSSYGCRCSIECGSGGNGARTFTSFPVIPGQDIEITVGKGGASALNKGSDGIVIIYY